MKRSAILNRHLNEAIASMGHTDLMIICDAGFPIPNGIKFIDLALTEGNPELVDVLRLIDADFISERVYIAKELKTNNVSLYQDLEEIYTDIEITTLEHKVILSEMAYKAKVIVRTGSFEPWGNIILQSGTDPDKFFKKPGLIIPEEYKTRMKNK